MFKIINTDEVLLTDSSFKKSVSERVQALAGCISFSMDEDQDIKYISDVYNEASRKYKRMHSGNPSLRFEKSWTGEIGEEISKYILTKKMKYSLLPREKIIRNGYDGGDIHYIEYGKPKIANVSSRKLSNKDKLNYVLDKADQYFALIPSEQLNHQYLKADKAFFIFILYNEKFIHKNVKIQNEIAIDIPLSAKWICPGFIDICDLQNMIKNKWISVKKRGEVLNGIYGDLLYNIPMYTDNLVIPISYLRKFNLSCQKNS